MNYDAFLCDTYEQELLIGMIDPKQAYYRLYERIFLANLNPTKITTKIIYDDGMYIGIDFNNASVQVDLIEDDDYLGLWLSILSDSNSYLRIDLNKIKPINEADSTKQYCIDFIYNNLHHELTFYK